MRFMVLLRKRLAHSISYLKLYREKYGIIIGFNIRQQITIILSSVKKIKATV